MDHFSHCPRCENRTLEHLKTYSHCIDCFYYVDHFYDSESAFFEARAAESLLDEAGEESRVEESDPEDEMAS